MRSVIFLMILLTYLIHPGVTQDNNVSSTDFQLCNDGCLKCSSKGQCEFCDIQDNNFLKNDTCAKFSINNCKEYTFDGNCKICDTNFYLAEGVCEVVDESSQIDNCAVYKSPGICLTCELEYILVQGECQVITTKKDSCVVYNESGTLCTNCANLVLSTDFQSCDKIFDNTTTNCK